MSKQDLRIEAMSDILDNLEIKVSPTQLKALVQDFSYHLDMEHEMESYSHTSFSERSCEKCKSKDLKIKELEQEVKVYNESVKRRRNASAVWVQDGVVRYEP